MKSYEKVLIFWYLSIPSFYYSFIRIPWCVRSCEIYFISSQTFDMVRVLVSYAWRLALFLYLFFFVYLATPLNRFTCFFCDPHRFPPLHAWMLSGNLSKRRNDRLFSLNMTEGKWMFASLLLVLWALLLVLWALEGSLLLRILPLRYYCFLVPKKEASAEGVVVPEVLQWVGTEVDFNSHFVS